MIDMSKFAVIVLCHCRPDNTTTVATLRKRGYTGKIYLVLDDEDPTIEQYRQNFKDETIYVFSKDEMLNRIDIMNNNKDKRCAVYARNACFDLAEQYGLKYFCQVDDDYTSFAYRRAEDDNKLYRYDTVNLDEVFQIYLEFMATSENIGAVAFAEPGDFVCGSSSNLASHRFLQKCMGSWICFTDRRLHFLGVMNDDVNTYALNGSRGQLFYTFDYIMIDTPETQATDGGMTDLYLGNGTYAKTFYTVLCCPSFVRVSMFGDKHFRIHHKFSWGNAMPKLISDKYKR